RVYFSTVCMSQRATGTSNQQEHTPEAPHKDFTHQHPSTRTLGPKGDFHGSCNLKVAIGFPLRARNRVRLHAFAALRSGK
ncbi:MAG: hypothetical protein ACX94A_13740, partial [Algiphilus sp.]